MKRALPAIAIVFVAAAVSLIAAGQQPAGPASATQPRSVATLGGQPGSVTPAASHAPAAAAMPTADQNALVKQYCVGCHNDRNKDRTSGLSFQSFDAATAADHADTVERMIRRLRAGMMPPVGAKRPDPATVDALVNAFETRLDRAAALNPNPGWRPSQRLNRAEYARAVKDLLAVDIDVNAFLPADTLSDGFDNIADAQTISPTLMEGYLRAASQISRLAVGDRNASATSVTYKIGRTASQMRHVEGAPMGTRGGTSVVHTFPADGDYVVKMSMHNEP